MNNFESKNHCSVASIRRRLLLTSSLAIAAITVACGGGGSSDPQPQPYAAWHGALLDATQSLPGVAAASPEVFNNQTVRHIMRISIAGNQWRIKVTNLFGKEAATFSGIQVAKSTGDSNIRAGTSVPVLFGGQRSVTLAAGTELYSDPFTLDVAALENIAVSIYFSSRTSMPTIFQRGIQTAYIGSGDLQTAESIAAPAANQRLSYYGITSIENFSVSPKKVVVAFGDSITAGSLSTVSASRRYPNRLDDRLKAAGMSNVSVVNSGIGGNRWIYDYIGPNGTSRFDRDVLQIPGVTHAIVLLGINDIGVPILFNAPQQTVTSAQIIAQLSAALTKAKSAGLKVFVGTLNVYKGAAYYTVDGDAMRMQVNAWIRSNTISDGVIDFETALKDPQNPLQLNPSFDSGDHLHPNDAGYQAMANAIDLAIFN